LHHHEAAPFQSAAQSGAGRLRLVLALTAGYMLAEVAGGLLTGSLALLSDAGHVFADVAGITMSLVAMSLAGRSANAAKTYGYYRLEILAAMLNGVLMVGIAALILAEAVRRLADPPDLPGLAVMAFALPGLAVNGASILLLAEGQRHSLNLRGAYLEVLSDLAGSAGVILAGLAIALTGLGRIDPVVSILIALLILPRAWKLLSEAVHVLLEGSPRGVDIEHVQSHIRGAEGVLEVHDLHVWTLTSGVDVVSAHVVVEEDAAAENVLDQLSSCLADHFDIEHSTFQIEQADRRATERAGH
jgi:cobalt-zinc-cadmium efflux system protein